MRLLGARVQREHGGAHGASEPAERAGWLPDALHPDGKLDFISIGIPLAGVHVDAGIHVVCVGSIGVVIAVVGDVGIFTVVLYFFMILKNPSKLKE